MPFPEEDHSGDKQKQEIPPGESPIGSTADASTPAESTTENVHHATSEDLEESMRCEREVSPLYTQNWKIQSISAQNNSSSHNCKTYTNDVKAIQPKSKRAQSSQDNLRTYVENTAEVEINYTKNSIWSDSSIKKSINFKGQIVLHTQNGTTKYIDFPSSYDQTCANKSHYSPPNLDLMSSTETRPSPSIIIRTKQVNKLDSTSLDNTSKQDHQPQKLVYPQRASSILDATLRFKRQALPQQINQSKAVSQHTQNNPQSILAANIVSEVAYPPLPLPVPFQQSPYCGSEASIHQQAFANPSSSIEIAADTLAEKTCNMLT